MSISPKWHIFIILLLQFLGLLFFAKGFFPRKTVLPGKGEFYHHDLLNPNGAVINEQKFDKLVFMVVDAMRSDFMFSDKSSMSFVHSLIESGNAIGFTAHSTPPTVTLPRLKGLTTGTTPSFLDAILNIADSESGSSISHQDSWLSQFKFYKNSKIHMFGDDTWLKLFPNFFNKVDGTSSFFVSDFTEVDNNVTRHLDHELTNSNEWDVLILHYLGLDHIGHKSGPNSPFMPKKQAEMDSIIKRIYSEISSPLNFNDEKTLMVIIGDHGMNDVGNHGGSSLGETSAALLFVSPFLNHLNIANSRRKSPLKWTDSYNYYERIDAIDVAATIASLFNFPIPKNSLGVIIDKFLPLWNKKDQLEILLQNALQLKIIVEASLGRSLSKSYCSQNDDSVDCLWSNLEENPNKETIYKFLKITQKNLTQSASNYGYDEMYIGFVLIGLGLLISLISFIIHVNDLISLISYLTPVILYAASLNGSSLIEEEHHIWYLYATIISTIGYIIIAHKKGDGLQYLILSLICIRLIKGWNTTGQKYNFGVSISSLLSLTENSSLLWLLIILTYSKFGIDIWTGGFSMIGSLISFLISFLLPFMSLVFKMIYTLASGETLPNWLLSFLDVFLPINGPLDSLLIAHGKLVLRLSLISIITRIFFSIWKKETKKTLLNDLLNLITIVLLTQSDIKNIPLFGIFSILKSIFQNAFKKYLSSFLIIKNGEEIPIKLSNLQQKRIIILITFLTLILQNVSFFFMGSTNTLATVDLSNAYNGVEEYNIFIVGILTFISNWTGPIYWSLSCIILLLDSNLLSSRQSIAKNQKWEILTTKIYTSLLFYLFTTFAMVLSCYSLRHHLFVWSVFSPKLLYVASWIGHHILIDVLLSAIFVYFY